MGNELLFLLLGVISGVVIAFIGGYVLAKIKADGKETIYRMEIDDLLRINEELEQELRPLKKRYKDTIDSLNKEEVEKEVLLERVKQLENTRRELEHEKDINIRLSDKIIELEKKIIEIETQMEAEVISVEKQLELIMQTKKEILNEISSMLGK